MNQKLKLVATQDTEDRSAASEEQSFDYSKLDDETATVAKTAASNIRGSMNQACQSLVEVGVELGTVREKFGNHSEKSQLRGEETWDYWVKIETGFSKSQANTLIRIGKKFGDLDPGHRLSFDLLAYLSQKSTPQHVVENVIERAQADKKTTLPQAKVIAGQVSRERGVKSKIGEFRRSPSRSQDQSALAGYEKEHGRHPYESECPHIRALYAIQELSKFKGTDPRKFMDEMRGFERWSLSDAQMLSDAIEAAQGMLEAWDAHHGKRAD